MEQAIQAVIDRDEIQQVLARYSRGVDRCDRALLEGVYWPEATESHGGFRGSAAEFIDWVLELLLTRYKACSHMLGQSAIEVDGETAGSETYFAAYHVRPTEAGDRLEVLGGRYVDRLEKRSGEWRFSQRNLVIDWSWSGDAEPQSKLPDESVGKRSRADVSFAVLKRG